MKPFFLWTVFLVQYVFGLEISDSAANLNIMHDVSEQNRIEIFRKDFNSSNSMYKVGYWMTTGGLLVCLTPELSGINKSGQYDEVMTLGAISFLAGIPLMGINANRMSGMVKKMDTGYMKPNSGWLYYGLAKGCQFAGISMMVIQGIIDAFSIVPSLAGAGDTVPPSQAWGNAAAIPLAASLGLEMFSWYKFSRLRHSAIKNVHSNGRLNAMYFKPIIFRSSADRLLTGATAVFMF